MGAHRRKGGEVPAPPRDLAAETAVLADQAEALLTRLEAGDADTRTVNELILLGLRFAEASAALSSSAAGQAVMEAAYAQGWADRDAVCAREHGPGAGQRSPRSRRGGGHLRVLPALPATAVRAAATAAVVAGIAGGVVVAGMHEEAAVARVAAPPARHAGLQRMAPDRAVVVPPSRRAPLPGPSAVVASARPVPVVAPVPAASASPLPAVPPPVAAVVPAPPLDVPRLLDLGATTRGPLTLTAGPQDVTWTVGTADGITVLAEGRPVTGGTLAAGQELDLTVMAPLGEGWVYVSAGQQTWTVQVTSDVGTPALALP